METAQGEEQTIENITRRALVVNFAAIHTSSMVSSIYTYISSLNPNGLGEFQPFVHAFFYLAALPEYIGPLRAEVEEVIEREDWTKEALDEMYKVDSFIKESQRKTPLGIVSAPPSCVCFTLTETVVMTRIARKDYTFADGTRIPQGTTVSIHPTKAHHDPKTYENPEQFEGFRFAKCGSSG